MSKPETLEQIAERLAGQMFETSGPDFLRHNACMILAALREVEAREGERCLAIIARSGERTEAADAERDEAVKRAEKAEAEVVAAKREAFEEAAKIADGYGLCDDVKALHGMDIGRAVARTIRSLAK